MGNINGVFDNNAEDNAWIFDYRCLKEIHGLYPGKHVPNVVRICDSELFQTHLKELDISPRLNKILDFLDPKTNNSRFSKTFGQSGGYPPQADSHERAQYEREEALQKRMLLVAVHTDIRAALFEPNEPDTMGHTAFRAIRWIEDNLVGGQEMAQEINGLHQELKIIGSYMGIHPQGKLSDALQVVKDVRQNEGRQEKRASERKATPA